VLLTLIAGSLMITAAAFQLGRLTRFVPCSVMIGFLTGVAVNIVLGQLPDLMGSDVTGDYPLAKAWHLLLDPRSIGVASLAAGLTALAIVTVLARSRLGAYASLVALAVPSAVVIALGADTVTQVRDVGEITGGLPLPALPHLSEL
jgi:SulP family sulfate permease